MTKPNRETHAKLPTPPKGHYWKVVVPTLDRPVRVILYKPKPVRNGPYIVADQEVPLTERRIGGAYYDIIGTARDILKEFYRRGAILGFHGDYDEDGYNFREPGWYDKEIYGA